MFRQRKKDRCDKCEEYNATRLNAVPNNDIEKGYQQHVKEKDLMRINREADKRSGKYVLCFDLKNIITLPKADISSFFYKRKLSFYNLTGYLSHNKQGYCAIWPECIVDRGGVDIAGAVDRIFEEATKENPDIKDITT